MTPTKQLRELDALIEDLAGGAYNDGEHLADFLIAADEALLGPEPAWLAGIEVQVIDVDAGSDARTGLTARVRRNDQAYEVALTDLTLAADSQLGRIVAAYRRWQDSRSRLPARARRG